MTTQINKVEVSIHYYDNPHPSECGDAEVRELWFALREKNKNTLRMNKCFMRKHYKQVYVEDNNIYLPSPDLLDTIFADFNCEDNPLATKEGQQKLKELEVRHTSMSVGDIIQIADEYHIVANNGFILVNPVEDELDRPTGYFQLKAIIEEIMTMQDYPSWDFLNGLLSCDKILGEYSLWYHWGKLLIVPNKKRYNKGFNASKCLELDDWNTEANRTITLHGRKWVGK
jgi:hypothetical protein